MYKPGTFPLTETARYAPVGTAHRAVDVVDGLAYLVGDRGLMCTAEMGDPANPIDLGCVLVANESSRLVAVDVRDGLAAVVAEADGMGSDTLVLVDVSDPGIPIVLSEIPTEGRSGLFSHAGVVLTGDRVFVSFGSDNGLQVYSVIDPSNPVLLGRRVSPGRGSHHIAVSGDSVFLATGEGGVDVFRLSGCRPPRRSTGRTMP